MLVIVKLIMCGYDTCRFNKLNLFELKMCDLALRFEFVFLNRQFSCLRITVLLRTVLRCDPLKLLIQFMTDKNIRPVDLFRSFDKDKQYRVTREQFVSGLKVTVSYFVRAKFHFYCLKLIAASMLC